MSKEKLYFENLDPIRFLAALMVFLGHGVSPVYEYLPIKNTVWENILNTISSGGTGVSIFFVLSGFLITYLLISEEELTGKISLKHFYIRRILRIWPLFFLVISFSFFLYPLLKTLFFVNSPLCSNLFYHLTFLSNFDVINIQKNCYGSDAMSQNITWSVSIEEQFYLFWPLIFVFLQKRFWIIGILFIIFLSIGFRMMNYQDHAVLYFHTLSVLIDLGIGGLTALLIKRNHAIRLFFEKSSDKAHVAFFIFSFSLIFWSSDIFSFSYGLAISRVFTAISFALIIAAQALTTADPVVSLKKLTFARKWGRYTYGIYLLHPIAITLTDISVRLLNIPKTNALVLTTMGMISFILTLILSKLSYDYFESYFLSMKDRFSAIKTSPIRSETQQRAVD